MGSTVFVEYQCWPAVSVEGRIFQIIQLGYFELKVVFCSFVHPGSSELAVPKDVGLVRNVKGRGGTNRLYVQRVGGIQRVTIATLSGVAEA